MRVRPRLRRRHRLASFGVLQPRSATLPEQLIDSNLLLSDLLRTVLLGKILCP